MSNEEAFLRFVLFAVSLEVCKILLKHYTESFMSIKITKLPDLPRPLALGGEAHRWDPEAWKALGYDEQFQMWSIIFGNRGAGFSGGDAAMREKIREYMIHYTGKPGDEVVKAAENFLDKWTDRYGHTIVGRAFKFLGFGSKNK